MSEFAESIISGMTVVGHGVATAPSLSGSQPKQKVSVYADPVSWLVFEAVERAVGDHGAEILPARETVGHIAVSDQCTGQTMREIAAGIAAGRVSPLRFSGANPGSIASLPAQLLGFSGPSLTLSMPPTNGLPFAVAIARIWLRQRSATHVLVTSHTGGDSGHRVTSTILREAR